MFVDDWGELCTGKSVSRLFVLHVASGMCQGSTQKRAHAHAHKIVSTLFVLQTYFKNARKRARTLARTQECPKALRAACAFSLTNAHLHERKHTRSTPEMHTCGDIQVTGES